MYICVLCRVIISLSLFESFIHAKKIIKPIEILLLVFFCLGKLYSQLTEQLFAEGGGISLGLCVSTPYKSKITKD